MLSKAKIKLIRSLDAKKFRREEGLFVAEGPKVVGDLLTAFPCRLLAATATWMEGHPGAKADEICVVDDEELRRASFLQHPQEVMALFQLPAEGAAPLPDGSRELVLALDDVQDPGNVGTILRIADWFGIRRVVCSPATADVFSPKVVQATMGALARVAVSTCDLPSWLRSLPHGTPVYGTFLDGDNMYGRPLATHGVIVMGNEGKGISAAVEQCVTERLFIPSWPAGVETSESLNVAVATAIVAAEFRRREGNS